MYIFFSSANPFLCVGFLSPQIIPPSLTLAPTHFFHSFSSSSSSSGFSPLFLLIIQLKELLAFLGKFLERWVLLYAAFHGWFHFFLGLLGCSLNDFDFGIFKLNCFWIKHCLEIIVHMDFGETKCSYGKPPWIFKGSALYQLHLVKAATVRACIPKDFRLVEAFGYTLGGFFLANYDDSPAGVFDELVVIAGLVWSPPTSCAWAAKVLVNSDEACKHGRKEVGLPSQVARFSKRITAVSRQPKSKNIGFLNVNGSSAAFCDSKDSMEVQVTEIKASSVKDSCNVNLTTFMPESSGELRGPTIKISLPSFSGGTEYYPNLLKYSCRIECRVRAVHPAKVSGPSLMPMNETKQSSEIHTSNTKNHATEEFVDKCNLLWESVMLSKPVLALEFSCMKMQVEAPVVVSNCKNSLATT